MSQPDLNTALGNPSPTGAETVAGPEAVAAGDFVPPLWLQALTYNAQYDRALADSVWPDPGVLAAGLAVGPRALGANMSVDVAAGRVVIAGGDMANQGKYLCRLANIVNVTVGPAPAGGLSRRDLVVARVYDDAVTGGGRNEWDIAVVAGTAVSANPQPPAVPASAEPLAELGPISSSTAAITGALITDRRRPVPRPVPAVVPPSRLQLWTPAFGVSPPVGVQLVQHVGNIVLNAVAANWDFVFPWGSFQYGYAANVTSNYSVMGFLNASPVTLGRLSGQAWLRNGAAYEGSFAMGYIITGA